METPKKELLTSEEEKRYVIFPIKHDEIWAKYKQAEANFWTTEELDLTKDLKHFNEELKNVNIRCSNIQLIASYPIEEREEGEEGEVGDRDEGGYYIDESGNISSASSASSEEDEGEDHVTSINSNKISNKLISSFF